MAIPQSQLDSWSHQGAAIGSRDTYATVKRALESANAPYAGNVSIFLQGSYGNDTNIYSESDVDVVICYDGAFFYDVDNLPADQSALFKLNFPGTSSYSYSTFKTDVHATLVKAFGTSVQPPQKAIKIAASGSRRNADVIVAFEHRRYIEYKESAVDNFYEGISFVKADGVRINNFPKYHSTNLTTKHQATANKYKPAIRIFKNMRSKATEMGLLAQGEAPSYFIEGLLYNVPNDKFIGNYSDMVRGILVWLHQTTDRTKFVCANERYYLLRDQESVCWPKAHGDKFIAAMVTLWDGWKNA